MVKRRTPWTSIFTMVFGKMDRKMARERSSGKTAVGTMAIGKAEISTAKVSFMGVMIEYTRETGRIISYMGMESFRGLMAKSIPGNILKTSSQGLADLNGQTERHMKDCG